MTRTKLDSLLQLAKAPVKGGKPNGVPYNFGKGSGTKGKGKLHKGLGFQPERGEQRKFGGHCNWCWRIGHKEAQCWFKQEYMKSNPSQDPLQQDIREWSNEKGQGHSQPKSKSKGCVEGELVSGVHTLLGGVVQVCHRLHVGEEEKKGRKVEQEVERESQVEETAHMKMTMDGGEKTQQS